MGSVGSAAGSAGETSLSSENDAGLFSTAGMVAGLLLVTSLGGLWDAGWICSLFCEGKGVSEMVSDWSWILLDLIVEEIGRQASEGIFIEAIVSSSSVFGKISEIGVRNSFPR